MPRRPPPDPRRLPIKLDSTSNGGRCHATLAGWYRHRGYFNAR